MYLVADSSEYLLCFSDFQGIVHYFYASQGQIVNKEGFRQI